MGVSWIYHSGHMIILTAGRAESMCLSYEWYCGNLCLYKVKWRHYWSDYSNRFTSFQVTLSHTYVLFEKKKFVQIFCNFLLGFFFSFWYSVVWTSCMCWILTPLSVISFTNIFSRLVGNLFLLLMVSFAVKKLLSLIIT